MKILIAGDFCDKNRVSDFISKEDYTVLFNEIKPIVESADFGIVNFEFPVVITEGKPIPKCGPNLKGQKQSIDAIKYAGFNVCTLANNHILDQGEQCCIDTKNLLESAGIRTVGVGENLNQAEEILYLEKDGEILAIINCCEHEFSIATDSSAGANPLNPIRQYYEIKEAKRKADYVLVIVHGGHEMYQLPSPRMQETYRFFIDAGADAVVNHHQHCYSGYEVYEGKPIFYGLGNFLFDNLYKDSIWNYGFMLQLQFEKNEIKETLIPYEQCNHDISIHLLNDSQKARFEYKIKELNSVILDTKRLEKETLNYYDKCSKNELVSVQPYRNRITKYMYRKGILPSWFRGGKKMALINRLNCESHLDKLKYALLKL